MKREIYKVFTLVYVTLFMSCAAATIENPGDFQQLPSPDWREQTIYFVMVDRFANGDVNNDSLMPGGIEYGPNEYSWNGGDLKGLIDKLDYIKGMGFTAIWITPPVENQWWDPSIPYAGYHGYWASSFTNIDAHYGNLDDYKNFVKMAHQKGIYVIQDIVCNHTGNYFKMTNENGAIFINTNAYPVYPREPFMSNSLAYYKNNGTNSIIDTLNAYHWTPDIMNWSNPIQLTNYQSSSLDDMNTENPLVLENFKKWYNYWIETVGIDGVRIDTARNVPEWFWTDFCFSTNINSPGMKEFAKKYAKSDFIMFGEVHTPGLVNEDQEAGKFTKDSFGNPVLDTVLYYPMYSAIQKVFSENAPTVHVKSLFDNLPIYYRADAISKMVTFIDNHDKVRFLNGNSIKKEKLALLFIYTSIGIPCVYYGTEQKFTETRATMFENGYHGSMLSKDYFDTSSEMYLFIKSLNALRKSYSPLMKGSQEIIYWNVSTAGILAYTRTEGEKKVLIIFNTASSSAFVNAIDIGLTSKTKMINVLSTNGQEIIETTDDGKIYLSMPAVSVKVLVKQENYIPY